MDVRTIDQGRWARSNENAEMCQFLQSIGQDHNIDKLDSRGVNMTRLGAMAEKNLVAMGIKYVDASEICKGMRDRSRGLAPGHRDTRRGSNGSAYGYLGAGAGDRSASRRGSRGSAYGDNRPVTPRGGSRRGSNASAYNDPPRSTGGASRDYLGATGGRERRGSTASARRGSIGGASTGNRSRRGSNASAYNGSTGGSRDYLADTGRSGRRGSTAGSRRGSIGGAPDLLAGTGKTGLGTGNRSRRGSNASAYNGSTGGSRDYLATTPGDRRSRRGSISGSRRGSNAGFQDELRAGIAAGAAAGGSRDYLAANGGRGRRGSTASARRGSIGGGSRRGSIASRDGGRRSPSPQPPRRGGADKGDDDDLADYVKSISLSRHVYSVLKNNGFSSLQILKFSTTADLVAMGLTEDEARRVVRGLQDKSSTTKRAPPRSPRSQPPRSPRSQPPRSPRSQPPPRSPRSQIRPSEYDTYGHDDDYSPYESRGGRDDRDYDRYDDRRY